MLEIKFMLNDNDFFMKYHVYLIYISVIYLYE